MEKHLFTLNKKFQDEIKISEKARQILSTSISDWYLDVRFMLS